METNKHRKWPDTFIFSLGSATAIFPNDIESHFNMGFWCTRCAAPDNRESWPKGSMGAEIAHVWKACLVNVYTDFIEQSSAYFGALHRR